MHAKGKRDSCRTSSMPGSADATIALSVHGPAGVLDLVVTRRRDCGRRRPRVRQAGRRCVAVPSIALLQTALGLLLYARSARDAGVQPGDVLVAASR